MTSPPTVDDALRNDASGCVAALIFFLALMLPCMAAVLDDPDDFPFAPSAVASPPVDRNAALGPLPTLGGVKDAAPPTVPTTAPLVVVTDPPAPTGTPQPGQAAAPQQPQAPPQPVETCSLSGSATVAGGSGGLSPGGGSYTATGPSSVTVSGYPRCHFYRIDMRSSNGATAYACFLDNFSVSIGSASGDTVNVTIQVRQGGC